MEAHAVTYKSCTDWCRSVMYLRSFESRPLLLVATLTCFQFLFPGTLQAQPEFKLETGWTWVLKPQPCDSDQRTWLIYEQVRLIKCEWNRLGDSLVCVVPKKDGKEYRLALFSPTGERINVMQASAGCGQAGVNLFSTEQPAAFAGVEVLSLEGMEKCSREAFESARVAKLPVMPFIGVPELRASWPLNYQFSLTLADGKRFDSTSAKGKVIVVDCWATWCGPCMEFLPVLRAACSKHHDKIEVVSICYDNPTDAKAKKAIDKHQITSHAHLLFAPAKESYLALWEKSMTGSESGALPRIFMILPSGELFHTTPQDFEKDLKRVIDDNHLKGKP